MVEVGSGLVVAKGEAVEKFDDGVGTKEYR